MKSKITLKKIAKEFDVSISTVSKALKDSHEISEEVRERIKAFAKYYNYKPNSLAVNLRNQKTKTIGVIIPQIVHHFFTKVISGIEHIANENGYNVMICLSNESYEKEVLNMDMLESGIVDGIIVSVAKETEEKEDYKHFKQLIDNGLPLVLFDREIPEINCNKVIVDDFGGGFLATKHLMNISCKRIAIITTPDHVMVGKIRKEGYIQALTENNFPIQEELIIKVNEKYDITNQIQKLFDQANPPDGIFAVNEIYAATVIKIAQKRNLKIPDEIAVMGFTDGLISEYTSPSLSAVDQHGYTMGKKAAEGLLKKLNNPELMIQEKLDLARYIERESTKL